MKYYISSCMFSLRFPALAKKIAAYVAANFDLQIIRCCTPDWKVRLYEERMPEGELREFWQSLPPTAAFAAGDEIWSLCHNCTNIIEEHFPGTRCYSLWELIDQDKNFRFPDYSGLKATVQDCWRSRDRAAEQAAVRSLLQKMHIDFVEAPKNHAATDFCGNSLYEPQVARNPKLAPKHYAENIDGLFLPHTEEEQKQLMLEYCKNYQTETVICYCHYCLTGLQMGGRDGRHIAHLLFDR